MVRRHSATTPMRLRGMRGDFLQIRAQFRRTRQMLLDSGPNLAESWATPAEFGPRLPDSWQHLAQHLSNVSANFGKDRLNSVELINSWSMLATTAAKSCRTSDDFGRDRVKSRKPDFSQLCSKFNQHRLNPTGVGQAWADCGCSRAKFRLSLAGIVWIWAGSS